MFCFCPKSNWENISFLFVQLSKRRCKRIEKWLK